MTHSGSLGTTPMLVAKQGKHLYRVPEVAAMLSISRSVVYEQLRAGRLRSIKCGRSRLIPARAVADYVLLLEQEGGYAA